MCDYDPNVSYNTQVATYVGLVPSQNQLSGNTRAGWKYRVWRKKFESQAKRWDLKKAPPGIKCIGIFTRHYGKRCREYDLENLIGGLKPLIDVLRGLGIIVNDDPKHWRGYYRQTPAADKVSKLTIEIRQIIE